MEKYVNMYNVHPYIQSMVHLYKIVSLFFIFFNQVKRKKSTKPKNYLWNVVKYETITTPFLVPTYLSIQYMYI